MTHILRFISILFLLCIFLTSCGGSEDILLEDFEELPSNSLSMSLDGSTWSSDSTSTGLGITAGSFSIGTFNNSDISTLFILASNSIGTYELGVDISQTPSLSIIDASAAPNYSTVNFLSSGQIEIVRSDEVNKTISGKFNAILVKSEGDFRTVTNGLFHELRYE